jgi:hypothetical protein
MLSTLLTGIEPGYSCVARGYDIVPRGSGDAWRNVPGLRRWFSCGRTPRCADRIRRECLRLFLATQYADICLLLCCCAAAVALAAVNVCQHWSKQEGTPGRLQGQVNLVVPQSAVHQMQAAILAVAVKRC